MKGTQDTMHTKYIKYGMCSCISKHAIHCSEGHFLVLISPARVESLMSFKTFTRVSQVTGCLPLPVSHSWRISVLIRSGLSLCAWTMLSTLFPESSSSRIVPNILYCVPISWGILIFFCWPGKLSSSCRVGVLPAVWSKEQYDPQSAKSILVGRILLLEYGEKKTNIRPGLGLLLRPVRPWPDQYFSGNKKL